MPTATGEPRSYLATEEQLPRFSRTCRPGTSSCRSSATSAARRRFARSAGTSRRGATVTAFYLSNVEQYLRQDGLWTAFCANVAALPLDAAQHVHPVHARRRRSRLRRAGGRPGSRHVHLRAGADRSRHTHMWRPAPERRGEVARMAARRQSAPLATRRLMRRRVAPCRHAGAGGLGRCLVAGPGAGAGDGHAAGAADRQRVLAAHRRLLRAERLLPVRQPRLERGHVSVRHSASCSGSSSPAASISASGPTRTSPTSSRCGRGSRSSPTSAAATCTLHLMYKALFELSADRAEFLSRLFSRRRPPGLDDASAPDQLFAAYSLVGAEPRSLRRELRAIVERARTRHGFPLDDEDVAGDRLGLRQLLCRRAESGVLERRRFGRGRYPTYRELQMATDGQGTHRGYLATEDNFGVLKAMQQNNLIVPLVGNFAGAARAPVGRRVSAIARRDRHGVLRVERRAVSVPGSDLARLRAQRGRAAARREQHVHPKLFQQLRAELWVSVGHDAGFDPGPAARFRRRPGALLLGRPVAPPLAGYGHFRRWLDPAGDDRMREYAHVRDF